MHEPKRATVVIRWLKSQEKVSPGFASLVFDMRELIREHSASPMLAKAALRLLSHEHEWHTYRRALQEDTTPNVSEGDTGELGA